MLQEISPSSMEPRSQAIASAEPSPIHWFRPLVSTALGNCVVDHVCLAKYKRRSGCRIGILFDPEIQFHQDLCVSNPYLDAAVSTEEFAGDPAKLPEPTHGRTWHYLIENTEPARLAVPPQIIDKVAPELFDRGLHPGDRIITIHAREPGFVHLPTPNHEHERFVDPKPFMELALHFAERGFKVVHIGDPACTPFPEHPNVLDAAHWPNKRLIHDLILIQSSELLVATDSGVWPIGVAFGTPTVLSNSCHGQPAMGAARHWFPWEPGHVVLNKHLFFKGEEISAAAGIQLFKGQRWHEVSGVTSLSDNTLAELLAASEALLSARGAAS